MAALHESVTERVAQPAMANNDEDDQNLDPAEPDPAAPGAYVDDDRSTEIPEPNEPG